MRSFRRVTQRVAPAIASVASVLLFATCDFDKISGTPKPITAADVARVFSITPTADSLITLGATITLAITPAAGIDLDNVAKVWSSSAPSIASVDDGGVVTGLSIGNAAITGRVLSPELDTGYARSHPVRVRFKAIRVAAIDSLTGKAVLRPVVVQGTNNANALQNPPITGATLTAHDSGSTANTFVAISGTSVQGRSNGIAFVVATFDGFKDSVKVKMRQVAKSLTFPTQNYTATHLNMNRPRIPMNLLDVSDSVMTTSPLMRFRSSDTTVFTIDSLTGILRVKKVDTARIFVRVDTINVGLTAIKSQKLVVAQEVGTLSKFAGDNQTDTVAQVLPINPTVTVLDSGNTPIAGMQVTFRKVRGLNATITDSVKTTDVNGRATLGSWKVGDVAAVAGDTVSATAGGFTTFFRATTVAGAPKKLGFSVQPSSVGPNVNFNPVIVVQVQDSLGNVVTNATNSVTLSLSNNPGAASITGTVTRAAVAGVATFTGISLTAVGQGYTLQASATGLQSAISNGFDIFGAKVRLGFTTQPQGGTATAPMQTVRVAIQDAQNITVANATDSVALTLQPVGPTTLQGTVRAAAVAGVATFNNLSVTGPGTFTILASNPPSGQLTSATSNSFTMAAVGPAARLDFQQQPSNVVAGAVISPSILVRVLDANGALVTSSTQAITLTIESTSPTGGTLSGNPSKAAVGGVATFNDITINKAGNGFKLLATATGNASIASATSTSFNVTTGAANKLGFTTQPSHTPFGTNIAPAVTVEVQDVAGNRVTTPSFVVSLALGGCTQATLSGGNSQTTVSGVATFSALSLSSQQAAQCTLAASATNLQSVTSTGFNSIAANGPARLRFTIQPAASTNAGSTMSAGTVAIQDVNGTGVTSTSSVFITLTVIGPGTLSSGNPNASTTTTASFSNFIFNTAGTYRLVANATGFDPDTSSQFTINAGTATRLGFLSQPTNIVAGGSFSPSIQVAVQDNSFNTIANATNAITLSIQAGIPFATGATTVTVNAVNGIATFPGLAIRKSATQTRLSASASGLSGTSSNTFDVITGPLAGLGFTVQPTTTTFGSTMSPPIQVTAQDSVGNSITDFSNPITLALTGGTPGAVLSGTKTITPTSGVSNFSTLSINQAGAGYQLSASASGVATSNSGLFNVTAGEVSLATTASDPWDLTVTGSTVVWAESQGIKTMSTAGGAVTNLVTTPDLPFGVLSDGTNVYWMENGTTGTLKRVPIGGGVVTSMVTGITIQGGHIHMAQDAGNIYFLHGVALKRIAKATSGAAVASATDIGCTATSFGSGDQPFVVHEASTQVFCNVDGNSIVRGPSGGGSFTTIATEITNTMIMSGTTLIWVNAFGEMKKLTNATTSGGTMTTLGSVSDNLQSYGRLATDGTNVYWANDGEGVRRVQLNGGTMFTLNPNHRVWGIGLDASNVFWARYLDATNQTQIFRAPK